ncbi:transporter substrate-binding domain-containing protein [Helicobacter fennelliae]|uniref:transporter substrate-binding domain-containing protein n=1 Tax=Helicobacter fennelliae TaxID=215 RepID=UPI000DD4E113
MPKKIAKDLLGDESKAELIIISPNERASSLESNQVDLVLATFIPRSGDEARVDFGTPYMKVAISIVNHYSDPSGMQDLLDSPLAIKKNTVLEDYSRQITQTSSLSNLITCKNALINSKKTEISMSPYSMPQRLRGCARIHNSKSQSQSWAMTI